MLEISSANARQRPKASIEEFAGDAETPNFARRLSRRVWGIGAKKRAVSVIMLRAQFGSHNSVFKVRVLFFISVSQTKAAV